MTISAIGPNFGQQAVMAEEKPASSITNSALDYDDFLTLLITQLKHQDPMSPLESQEFSAQLAQFSSVEQLYGLNNGLNNIQNILQSQEEDNSLDYVGKTVKTYDNTIVKNEESIDACAYHLENDANVSISIFDESGTEVYTVQEGWKKAGEHSFNWNGSYTNGDTPARGTYTFEVTATDGNGVMIDSQTYFSGEVTGVNYMMGTPYLVVSDRMVDPDNIFEVTKTTY